MAIVLTTRRESSTPFLILQITTITRHAVEPRDDGGGRPHPRHPPAPGTHPVREFTPPHIITIPSNHGPRVCDTTPLHFQHHHSSRPEQLVPGLLGLEEDIAKVRLARNRRDVEVVFHAADLAAGRGEEGRKEGGCVDAMHCDQA